MPHRSWTFRLFDILKAINLINLYIKDQGYDEFTNDSKTVDAVLRNLEIIGEASRFIPSNIKDIYPEVEWIAISGLRNVIVHEYFGISLQIIWQTIQIELPKLKQKIEQIRIEHSDNESSQSVTDKI